MMDNSSYPIAAVTKALSKPEVPDHDPRAWVQDIVYAQGDTDSEAGESTSSDSDSSTEEIDLIKDLIGNPSGAITVLRDLYTKRRRLGTNEDLWEAMEAITMFLCTPRKYIDKASASRVYPALLDAGLPELLERIASDGDLFEECTEWTENVLQCLQYLVVLAKGTQRWDGTDWLENDTQDCLYVHPDLDVLRRSLSKLFALTVEDAWTHRYCFKVGCRNDQYKLEDWAPTSADIRLELRGLLFMISPFLNTPAFARAADVLRSYRRLCVMLWMAPDDDLDGADSLFAIAASSFDSELPSHGEKLFATFVIDDMVAVYGAAPVLERIRQALNRPELPGGGLHCTLFVRATDVTIMS
ncbi:hypothetical protein PENSPDRAFT_455128 [Peniophora sp. CONT]|nr:hypothetical protein PENSPDRAFT_455128 [Peniophora sp. CONT]